MMLINVVVGALLLPWVATADTALDPNDTHRELWGNANECDSYGNGCPADRWCDEDGGYVCWRKRQDGERCNRNEKCLSDNCVNWVCAPTVDPCLYTTCPEGTYCDLGVCVDSTHCYSDADCLANEKCEYNLCVDPCTYTTCPQGTYCELGNCLDNQHCYGDDDCRHNAYCSTDGQCVQCYQDSHCGYFEKCENYLCVEDDGRCHIDSDCLDNLHCRDTGECVQCFLDLHCSSAGLVCKNYACVECRYDSHCLYGEVCHNHLCVDTGHCYSDADCLADEHCANNLCVVAGHCYSDGDCLANEKCENNACVDPCIYTTCPVGTTCELGVCLDNEHCYSNADCPDDWNCRNTGDCVQCFLDTHCAHLGLVCKSYVCVECRFNSHCDAGEICQDNLCVRTGQCYSDADCLAGEKCGNNICEVSGHCYSDADCLTNEKCENNICVVDGHCYSDADCQTGYCNHLGLCVECRLDSHCAYGEVCIDNLCTVHAQCASDYDCSQDEYCNELGECKLKCYDHHDCPLGYWCDIASNICSVTLENGGVCVDNVQCTSGWCKTRTYAGSICAAKKVDGATCSSDIECQSEFCYNGVCRPILHEGDACQDTYECAIGLHCSCTEPHTCVYLKAVGEGCKENCECDSNWCVGWVCVDKYGLGAVCEEDSQCASGHCDNLECGTYYETYHCGSNTCVPVMGAGGDYCTQNYQCTSDLCQGNVCTHAKVVDRHGFD